MIRLGGVSVLLVLVWGLGCAGAERVSEGVDPTSSDLAITDYNVRPLGPAFIDAVALRRAADGSLAVVDAARSTVVRLDADGVVLTTLGGPGTDTYALLDPSDADPTTGLLTWIADTGNGRLQAYGRRGELRESVPVPSDAEAVLAGRPPDPTGRPSAVASAPDGVLYALDMDQRVVMRWDNTRRLDQLIGGPDAPTDGRLLRPVALALAPGSRLLVADAGHAAVLVFDAFGTFERRLALGVEGVRFVALADDRLALTLADRVLLYSLEGERLAYVPLALGEPLRAAVSIPDGLIVLTASRLWRVE